MIKFYFSLFFFLILSYCFSYSVFAKQIQSPKEFALQNTTTYIGFDVRYLGIRHVNGQFHDFHGSFSNDATHPEYNHADIIINTKSIDTGSKYRDRDLKGSSFFDVDQYPTMIFYSKNIKWDSGYSGTITGNLTLLGVTKPLKMHIQKIKTDSDGDAFIVTGQIKRTDFGMNALRGIIGNNVFLTINYNTNPKQRH
jgi:polyisoprenoid-binding protein YceI